MLGIFKRKKKKLTSHERAIAVMYLQIKANELQREIDLEPNEDTWCKKHDVNCIKSIIAYLD